MFDGVAVIEDRDRNLIMPALACISLSRRTAIIDGDQAIVARGS